MKSIILVLEYFQDSSQMGELGKRSSSYNYHHNTENLPIQQYPNKRAIAIDISHISQTET
jgi:hypothetical protein